MASGKPIRTPIRMTVPADFPQELPAEWEGLICNFPLTDKGSVRIMNIVQIEERSGLREYSRDIQGADPPDQPGTDPAAGLVHCEHPLGGSGLRCIGGFYLQLLRLQGGAGGRTVESVWCEIFHLPDNEAVFRDTEACVTWMYERMEYGCRQYPGFFTLHSLGFMRRKNPMVNAGCSRPGSISWTDCVWS